MLHSGDQNSRSETFEIMLIGDSQTPYFDKPWSATPLPLCLQDMLSSPDFIIFTGRCAVDKQQSHLLHNVRTGPESTYFTVNYLEQIKYLERWLVILKWK